WGSDSVELFKPLFDKTTAEKRSAEECFNDGIAQLYSKAWSAELLKKILTRSSRGHEAPSWLCTEAEVGVAVSTVDEALSAIAAIRKRGHHNVVAKEAHGVAGSNALRLFEPEILENQKR